MYTPSDKREVVLPAGRWRYWFDDSKVIVGPAKISRNYPIGEFPVYIRDGAIIPMHISREYTGIGEREWDNYLTLNIYPCQDSSFEVPATDKTGTMQVSVHAGNPTTVTLGGAARLHVLRVFSEAKPVSVDYNGVALAEGQDWQYQSEQKRLIVKTESALSGSYAVKY
jgi:alpha-glucosidase (family GH31 glycosyl hydrolase)